MNHPLAHPRSRHSWRLSGSCSELHLRSRRPAHTAAVGGAGEQASRNDAATSMGPAWAYVRASQGAQLACSDRCLVSIDCCAPCRPPHRIVACSGYTCWRQTWMQARMSRTAGQCPCMPCCQECETGTVGCAEGKARRVKSCEGLDGWEPEGAGVGGAAAWPAARAPSAAMRGAPR